MPASGSGPVSPGAAFDIAAAKNNNPRVAAFLDNPAVAEPLKQAYTLLHIQKRIDLVAALIDTGELDAHMHCDAHPMGGFLAQLASLPRDDLKLHLRDIFAALDARNLDVETLQLPTYYNGSSTVSSLDGFGQQSVTMRPLVQWLMEKFSLKTLDIAEIAPRLLGQNYTANETTQPLIHHYMLNSSRRVADLAQIAEAAGTLDFLDAVNPEGRALLFRLGVEMQQANALDLMSWILQRRPELIHTTDALGWTVLDRYVQRNAGETVQSRFLIAAGARFRWQVPPGLSHADAMEFRNKHDRANKSLRKTAPPTL